MNFGMKIKRHVNALSPNISVPLFASALFQVAGSCPLPALNFPALMADIPALMADLPALMHISLPSCSCGRIISLPSCSCGRQGHFPVLILMWQGDFSWSIPLQFPCHLFPCPHAHVAGSFPCPRFPFLNAHNHASCPCMSFPCDLMSQVPVDFPRAQPSLNRLRWRISISFDGHWALYSLRYSVWWPELFDSGHLPTGIRL